MLIVTYKVGKLIGTGTSWVEEKKFNTLAEAKEFLEKRGFAPMDGGYYYYKPSSVWSYDKSATILNLG